MGSWKISYPSGLDNASSYDLGKAIYDKYGVIAMTHDTTKMCRAVGQVSSLDGVDPSIIIAKNITNYPNEANSTFTPL